MKTALKVLAALAAVAGVVYVIATYGEKIVAWARKVLSTVCWEDCSDEDFCGEDCCCEEADFEG